MSFGFNGAGEEKELEDGGECVGSEVGAGAGDGFLPVRVSQIVMIESARARRV